MSSIVIGGLAQRYGPLLVAGAFIWSLITYIISVSFALSSLPSPVPMSAIFIDMWSRINSAWANLVESFGSGKIDAASVAKITWNVIYAMGEITISSVEALVVMAFSYISFAYTITMVLPGPLKVLSVVVWPLSLLAEIILLTYLVNFTFGVITSLINTFRNLFLP